MFYIQLLIMTVLPFTRCELIKPSTEEEQPILKIKTSQFIFNVQLKIFEFEFYFFKSEYLKI